MKIFNLLMAVIFVVFAFVQVDDPDPLEWILIYGSVAVSCILAAFRLYFPIALILLLVLFAGYAVFLWPGVKEWLAQDDPGMLFDDVTKMQYRFVEEAREFLGLVLCCLVLAFHLILSQRKRFN